MQNADSNTKTIFTNRGIDFQNAPPLDPAEIVWHSQEFAKTRRRTSIYLADCIIELSDNYLLYKETPIHKNDLAQELRRTSQEDNYNALFNGLSMDDYYHLLGKQLQKMTVEQIADIPDNHCQILSAKYLSNLLEVKTQWIYNARSIMRRYPLATRPHDPAGILGVSHYQDVTRPCLTTVDSLRLLQEYLDAKQRGFYFSDDPDTLIEATPTELENRALGLNALRKGEKIAREIAGEEEPDPLPRTVDTPRLKVTRATMNLDHQETRTLALLFGKSEYFNDLADTEKVNAQITFYREAK